MGFKLPGQSIHSGTSAHRSALKMKAQELASALKQKDIGKKGLYKSDKSWKEGQESAKKDNQNLDALVKKRKGLEKGSNEYNKTQNAINKALGNKKRYAVTEEKDETKKVKSDVVKTGDEKKAKVDVKTETKKATITAKEGLRDTRSRSDVKRVKAEGKGERKKSRIDVRTARKETRKSTRKATKEERKARKGDILEEKEGILRDKGYAAEDAGKTRKAKRLMKRAEKKGKRKEKKFEKSGDASRDWGNY